jgi:hypothetical protein
MDLTPTIDGRRWRVETQVIEPGPITFYLDAPRVGSIGPVKATVRAATTEEVGPLALEPLSALTLRVEPPPDPQAPATAKLEPIGLEGARTRHRDLIVSATPGLATHLPAGRYRLTCWAPHRAPMRSVIVINPTIARFAKVELRLHFEARLPVTIITPGGDPPGTLRLRYRLTGGEWMERQPEAANRLSLRPILVLGGRIQLGELPPETVEFEAAAHPSGAWRRLGTVTLDPGDNPPAMLTWRE